MRLTGIDFVTDSCTTALSKRFPPFIEIESSLSALNVMLIPVPVIVYEDGAHDYFYECDKVPPQAKYGTEVGYTKQSHNRIEIVKRNRHWRYQKGEQCVSLIQHEATAGWIGALSCT